MAALRLLLLPALAAELACAARSGRDAAAHRAAAGGRTEPAPGQVNPPLDPESHRLFYRHDYPHDQKPPVGDAHDFQHPYPLVQDTDQYDKDYVKDENSDGGEWKVQMEYDILRNKVFKAKADAEAARKAAEKKEEGMEASRKKLADAEKKAQEAQAAADAARDRAKKAQEQLDKLEKAAQSGGDSEAVDAGVAEAQKDVEKEISDLEECKKKLQEAQDRLKDLMEKKQKAEEEHAKEQPANAEKNKQAKNDAESTAASSKEQAAKELQKAKKDAEEAKQLREEAENHRKEYEEARKKYEENVGQVQKDEEQIEEAKKRLRHFRDKQISEHSGISKATEENAAACHCPSTGSEKPEEKSEEKSAEKSEEKSKEKPKAGSSTTAAACPPCAVHPSPDAGGAGPGAGTPCPPDKQVAGGAAGEGEKGAGLHAAALAVPAALLALLATVAA